MSHLLIVEDDVFIRESLINVLEVEGHEVLCAANGREALTQIATRVPDAILLDLMMPIMNGWEVLEALEGDSRWNSIPVLVLTASGAQIPLDSRRVRAVLRKPFAIEALLSALQVALN